ncbi:MAG: HAD family hydrolase [Candidatus Thorarchaeota archaeon]|nr:MAG: HAD family hydrolase [Candidatus Thorarchaeota archaeon]
MHKEIKVIAFDLDGVLYDGPSAAFHLAQQVGLGKKYQELFMRMATENLTFEESVRQGAMIWEGVEFVGEYRQLVKELPLREESEETLDVLKAAGYQIGCISSGVSQFFMEPFAEKLNLDFAHSNILGMSNGKHSGTIEYAMGGHQKAETALRILQERNLSTKNFASIGDGTNDIDLFGVSAFSIAFNPENEEVSGAATATIHSKNLDSILEYFI